MKISELSFSDIIPQNMKNDKTIRGFSRAFDHILDLYRSKIGLVTLFDHLDILSNAQLDAVAGAIDIPWYDTGFVRTTKIEILRNYKEAYFNAGTPKAIEDTLSYIFGTVRVSSWYEYSGSPFHFKLSVARTVDESSVRIAARTLQRITPAVSKFDNVEKYIEADSEIYTISDARRLARYMSTARAGLED